MRMRAVVFVWLGVLTGGCSDGQSEPGRDAAGDTTVVDGTVKPDLVRDSRTLEEGVLPDGKLLPDLAPWPDSDPNKRSCYAGPVGTAGKGICQAGVQYKDKTTGQWGLCQGEVLPRNWEICGDGLDTNCDGSKSAGCKTLLYLRGEINGKIVKDDSGNKRDGTIVYGNVSSVKSGIGSKSLKFADGRVAVPIKIGPEFTLSLWLRTSRKQAQYVIYSKDNASKSLIDLNTTAAGGVNFNLIYPFFGGTCNVKPMPPKSINDGKWYLLTMVAGNQEVTIYLNGQQGSICKKVPLPTPSLPFTSISLGRPYDSRTYFFYEGELDELWFEGKVWSGAQIKDYYDFWKP